MSAIGNTPKSVFFKRTTIFAFFACTVFSPWSVFGGCPGVPTCGDQGLVFNVYDINNPEHKITNKMVVQENTSYPFYIKAWAYGDCRAQYISNDICTDTGLDLLRMVGNVEVMLDISSSSMTGTYLDGRVVCYNAQVLETGSPICGGGASLFTQNPGIYDYRITTEFNPVCWANACTDSLAQKLTVYVADPSNESYNREMITGKGVSVSSGILINQDTDFIINGPLGMTFNRYYHTIAAGTQRSFGNWGSTYDARLSYIGFNNYKIFNADGTVTYYSDNSQSSSILPAVMPVGDKTKLFINSNGTYSRRLQNNSIETFDNAGYMIYVTDTNGNKTRLTRNENKNLIAISDPAGRVVSIEYNDSNTISWIYLPDGNVISYTYDNWGDLVNVVYAGKIYKTYEYYGWLLSGIRDGNQNYLAKYVYGDYPMRVTESSTDGTNDKLTYNYTDNTHSSVTDALGNTTTYTIDRSFGKSVPVAVAGSGCSGCGASNISYVYDSNANVISTTDANGNVSSYSYDGNGDMNSKTEASGTNLQRTTTYLYDSQWNVLTSLTDPKNNTTEFQYDTQGKLVSVTDANDNETLFTRNAKGLITEITDAENNITTITYDNFGNLATVSDEMGNVTINSYDIMGRLILSTDGLMNATRFTYDQRGRTTQVEKGSNQVVRFSYDLSGNLVAVTDSKGNQEQFSFDTINRLIKETDSLGKEKSYSYDIMSNLYTRKDAKQKTTTYIYDDHYRLKSIRYSDGTTADFTYDPNGNMLTASNQNITYTFTYDFLNRKTSVTDSFNRTILYGYDANSNRASLTSPVGARTYTYDSVNRLATLQENSGLTYTFGYDKAGKRKSLGYPNGVITAYTYDSASRLTSLVTKLGAQALNSYNFTYDNVGNRLTLSDVNGLNSYSYDSIYRLLQATHPDQPNENYSYDSAGNRLPN